MKKRPEAYPPMTLLKRVTAEYPGCWDKMKMFHDLNGKGSIPDWELWCYAPISAAIAVATNGLPVEPGNQYDFLDAIPAAQCIAALAPWRISKEVYIMDPDMEALLAEQDDMDIPGEVLLQLPYPCIYIQCNKLTWGRRLYHGMFVHLESDQKTQDRELRILLLSSNGETLGFPIHIDTDDLTQSVRRMIEEAQDTAEKMEIDGVYIPSNIPQDDPGWKELTKMMQIILYICAANAEIAPNSEQGIITKRTLAIRDKYAEIRKWDVGTRIGMAVRRRRHQVKTQTQEPRETSPEVRASPKPHMRRGHWHHYWTGPKDEPEKRKLILKWQPPTMVGIADDELPMVLHLVRADTDQT